MRRSGSTGCVDPGADIAKLKCGVHLLKPDPAAAKPAPAGDVVRRLADMAGFGDDARAWGMALADDSDVKVDRNANKRVKAAYAAFEERRLQEMSEDGSGQGLRLSQKKELIRSEFKRSPDNPLNGTLNVKHNATKEEVAQTKAQEKARVETLYSTKTSN